MDPSLAPKFSAIGSAQFAQGRRQGGGLLELALPCSHRPIAFCFVSFYRILNCPDIFVSVRSTREVPFLSGFSRKLTIFGAREYEGEELLRSLKNQDQW